MQDEAAEADLVSQRIVGLIVSDGPSLQRARSLNRLLIAMIDPRERARYAGAPEDVMNHFGLTPHERDLLARRDWPGMMAHGASIYAMAKGARLFGQTLLDIGASMRGCQAHELKATLPIHTLIDEEPRG